MTTTLLRADVRPDAVDDVEAAVTTMFAALAEAEPDGLRYASCRVPGTTTFVVLLQVEDGRDDPLATMPEFADFQDRIRASLAGPPMAETLTVLGSYNLF